MSSHNPYQDVVDEYIATQPWYLRRKDTITAIAGMILQVAQWAVVLADNAPVWVGLVITVIIGICQALVHARTKGAVTPSMGQRLADKAIEKETFPPLVSATEALLSAKSEERVSVENLKKEFDRLANVRINFGDLEEDHAPAYPAPAVGEQL